MRSFNLLKVGARKVKGNEQFSFPREIAVDSDNNYYITDEYNHRIQKYSPDGQYIQTIGNYGKANGELALPQGIAINKQDEIYIADTYNNRIQVFDKKRGVSASNRNRNCRFRPISILPSKRNKF